MLSCNFTLWKYGKRLLRRWKADTHGPMEKGRRLPHCSATMAAHAHSHGVGKFSVIPERELIVKGQHRKLPGEPSKVLIKQVGQPNAAREQDQRGFGLGILKVAIGKGFPAADREGSGWINTAKFCKCHGTPPFRSR